MKTAIIVAGAESTGTRVVTNMLLKQGFYGDVDDPQRVVQKLLNSEVLEEKKVVVRRNIPHGEIWDGLSSLLWSLYERQYALKVIVTVRDPYCVLASQGMKQKHAFNIQHAYRKVMRAYVNILAELTNYDVIQYVILPYETVIDTKGKVLQKIFMLWELEYDEKVVYEPLRNENEKYYVHA